MRKVLYVFLAVCFGFLIGCAGVAKKPDWILKGSGAFPKDKKVLYGVGIAEGIKSEALRRTTSDNRAIAEISKQLSTMSTSLMRDYMSSASVPEQEKTSGEQYVESTIKTFTSNTLSGVKIMDRWENGKTMYSLAALNLEDLKTMTDQIKELSQQVKDYIKANAEKAFDKLELEQEKRGK
ncbi:MAG: LPP20 family lipoprotein [Elusimicrobia bacterium]|nr:LPP20 family lipoprotein [Candidatus Liberimonas magnetica]